ncbi:unnamed protein product [Phytophthora fragariaefolia]|uniref:Unnamed protein product n=1 Tax=Phytophthora fragariaefolia TaxID=1490495 RepID=A0A9W6XRI3_9STRA|nr:unnamed protein product [Phytophthora fragariaefolia]
MELRRRRRRNAAGQYVLEFEARPLRRTGTYRRSAIDGRHRISIAQYDDVVQRGRSWMTLVMGKSCNRKGLLEATDVHERQPVGDGRGARQYGGRGRVKGQPRVDRRHGNGRQAVEGEERLPVDGQSDEEWDGVQYAGYQRRVDIEERE